MERPDDCPDPSGNGGGCDALHRHVEDQGRFLRRLGAVEVGLGTLRVDVGATKDIAARAEVQATRAAESSAAVHAVICAPINDIIAKYASTPPPDLLDTDDGEDIATDLAIQIPWMGARKIRREQARAAEAEQARIRLEAEKLVAERHAADLKEQKERDDKRHARNMAILASIAAVATMVAGALAILGKVLH